MHPLLKELERDNDPHDVLEIAPGVVLAARAEPEFAALAPGAVSRAAEPIFQAKPASAAAQAPSLDATFRADDVDHRHAAGSPIGKWTRAIIGLLFAMGSAGAAVAWDHYGDRAKQMIASWTPLLVATTSPPPASAAPTEQPGTPAVSPPDTQPAAATVAPAQPAAAVQPAPAVAPNAPSPDQVSSLASMAKQIEQLKASVEQLKAGQEQMSRDIARASEVKASEVKASEIRPAEPNLRPRIAAPKMAAPPPRPAAGLTHKPRPSASAAPYLPPPPALPPIAAPAMVPQPVPEAQATVETDGNPVVRPPLPVR